MYAGDRFRGMGVHLPFYRCLPAPSPGPIVATAPGPSRYAAASASVGDSRAARTAG